jgi:hypothetical protein
MPRIHAINILRAIFKTKALTHAIDPYHNRIFEVNNRVQTISLLLKKSEFFVKIARCIIGKLASPLITSIFYKAADIYPIR